MVLKHLRFHKITACLLEWTTLMENYNKNGHSKKIPNKKKNPLPQGCSNDATAG
jgi:hypothetical protein